MIKKLIIAMVWATAAAAQSPGPPQIVTNGRGEIEVTPDRAEIVLRIETRAPDGGRAGADNARATRAVLDTLRQGFNLRDADIATVGYSLHPQMVYPGGNQPPRVAAYVAMNSVRIRTAELARAGALIDAGLAKGATSVGGLSFYASTADSVRRRALALAVEHAMRDAEAMAVAAGGRLGGVIEILAGGEPPDPRPVMEMRALSVHILCDVTLRKSFVM